MVQLHRQALLIVDVFNDFRFEGGTGLAEQFRPAIPQLALLREHFRGRGVPVVYVNDNFDRWHEDLHGVVAYTREAGPAVSREAADALMPGREDVRLLKSRHSAFYRTQLPALLEHLQVGELVLAGMAGDACVFTTALDAHVHGYKVQVVRDAIASQTQARNRRVLEHLRETLGMATPGVEELVSRIPREGRC